MVELQDSSWEWKGPKKAQSRNVLTVGIWREGGTWEDRYVSDEHGFMGELGRGG